MADLASLFAPPALPGGGSAAGRAYEGAGIRGTEFTRQIVMSEALERDLAPEDGDPFFDFVGKRLFELGDVEGALGVAQQRAAMAAGQAEAEQQAFENQRKLNKESIDVAKFEQDMRKTDLLERKESRAPIRSAIEYIEGFEDPLEVQYDSQGNIVGYETLKGGGTTTNVSVDARPPVVGGSEATKPTINTLQDTVLNAGESIGRLTQIEQLYDRDFLTLEGKIGQWWRKSKDFLNVDLSPEDQKQLEAYTDFQSSAMDNLNLVLNQLSGAAISPAEAKRIRAAWPDPAKDSPREFISKVRARMRDLKLAKARATYILGGGGTLKDIETGRLSITGMKTIIKDKIRMWKKQGLSDAEIIQRRKDTFGM
jgi:hypothetical protein